jgi:hypothetical protein
MKQKGGKMSKERVNVSLTGSDAVRLKKLHHIIQNSPMVINVSLADVVKLALLQLEAKLSK